MTIKFERFADNHMCKDYYYKIYDDEYHGSIGRKITITEYEFDKLFKDMAKELNYEINKPWDAKLSEKIADKISNKCPIDYTKIDNPKPSTLDDSTVLFQFDNETKSWKGVLLNETENNRKWTDQTKINQDIRDKLDKIDKNIKILFNDYRDTLYDRHVYHGKQIEEQRKDINYISKELRQIVLEKLDKLELSKGHNIDNVNNLSDRLNKLERELERLRDRQQSPSIHIPKLYDLNERLDKLEFRIEEVAATSMGITEGIKSRLHKLEEQKDIANDKIVNNINRLDKLEDHDTINQIFIRTTAQNIQNIFDRLDKLEDKIQEPAWPLYVRKDEFDNIRYDIYKQIDGLGSKKISHIEHKEDITELKEELHRLHHRLAKLEEDIESNRDD